MPGTVSHVVKQFHHDSTHQLEPEAIRSAGHDIGYQWRQRLLDPVVTIQLFFVQILSWQYRLYASATSGSVGRHRRGVLPGPHEAASARVSAGAAVAQRSRTTQAARRGPLVGPSHLLGRGLECSDARHPCVARPFWPIGGQKPGCGLPVAHLMTRFHAGIGTVLRVLAAPLRTQDMFQVIALHPELHPSDVLVSGRGGCAEVNSARLVQGGVHAVFRVHQTHIVDCHRLDPMSAPLRGGARATREAALALVGKAWCVRSTRRVAGV